MAGIKGRSGGKRANTGVKAKITDPTVRQDWDQNLRRAITSASANGNVLRKASFFSTAEIKTAFGKGALREFKEWFEATKHFDQILGDDLAQQLASNRIDEVKFKRLLYTKAYFWVWSIHPEKQRAAWQLSRGFTSK